MKLKFVNPLRMVPLAGLVVLSLGCTKVDSGTVDQVRAETPAVETVGHFKYDSLLNECVNSDGSPGHNKNEFGQCADLANFDLTGIDLAGQDLSGSNFSSSVLVRANLQGANLEGANFDNADLSDANLSHARLDQARLSLAKLPSLPSSGTSSTVVAGTAGDVVDRQTPNKDSSSPSDSVADGSSGSNVAVADPLPSNVVEDPHLGLVDLIADQASAPTPPTGGQQQNSDQQTSNNESGETSDQIENETVADSNSGGQSATEAGGSPQESAPPQASDTPESAPSSGNGGSSSGSSLQELVGMYDQVKAEIANGNSVVLSLRDSRKPLVEEAKALREKVVQIQNESLVSINEQISVLNLELKELRKSGAEKTKRDSVEAAIKEAKAKRAGFEAEINQLSAKRSELRERIKAFNVRIRSARAQVQDLAKQLKSLSQKIKAMRKK